MEEAMLKLGAIRRSSKSPMCDFWHRLIIGGWVAAIIILIGVLQWLF